MSVTIDEPEEASSGRLPELVPLLDRVLTRPLPWLPDLEWLYVLNPSGRTWYVNARNDAGELIAHYALVPCPPLDDPRFASLRAFFALNVAVDPAAGVPGLMVACARKLFQHVQSLGNVVLLGVGNENSTVGLARLLGFEPLGRLALRVYPPFALPRTSSARALRADDRVLEWRVSRPNTDLFVSRGRRALLRRIHRKGMPIDAVLTVDAPGAERLELRGTPRSMIPAAPRLYAGFGPSDPGGFTVPERLRPSPLEYMFRPLTAAVDRAALRAFLASRRFEFFDFDVV